MMNAKIVLTLVITALMIAAIWLLLRKTHGKHRQASSSPMRMPQRTHNDCLLAEQPTR
jgi:hypothetical protein